MATLLAAYSFDEASGNALDYSGNGFDFGLTANGTRTAGHTNTAATKSGGSGTLIPLPAGLLAAVNASASRTLMCWIKGSGATWYVRCNHSDISSGGWGFLNLTGTTIGPRVRNASGPVQYQGAIPGGGASAYHLAASYDDADDTLRTFVNGVLVDSRTCASPIRSDADALDIMEWGDGNTWLDDLRFFDGAITIEAEIVTLMNTPVTAAEPPTEVTGTASGSGGGAGTATGAPEVAAVIGTAAGVGGGIGTAVGVREVLGFAEGDGGGFGDMYVPSAAPAAPVATIGSSGWGSLLAIVNEAKAVALDETESPPVACPRDGEPLLAGPGGALYCPFDGWRPD